MGKVKGRVWLAGALLLLAAALVPGGLWLATEEPGQQRQRLPDGSSLALLGWTYGSSHVFRTGPRWQTLLWPLAPPSVRERLSDVLEVQPERSAENSLVLWMLRRPVRDETLPVFLEVANERGETLFTETGNGVSSAGMGHRRPEPWVIDAFPRRGKFVLVRLLQGLTLEKRVPVAEFRVPNPDSRSHPTWPAPPLPVAQSQEDLTFKLTGLTTGMRLPGLAGSVPKDELSWSRATFRVEQAGRPTTNWYPEALTLSDATGNRWASRFATSDFTGLEVARSFPGQLDPDETYQLQVKFTNRNVVETRDQWVLPPIPLPAAHARRPLGFVATRNEVRIRALEVLGPWSRVPNRLSPEPFSYLRLVIPPEARMKRQVQLVRATDQRGRDLLPDPDPWAEGRDGSVYFRLNALSGVKAVHLTFGVHRSYDVEFLARPSIAAGSGP